MYRLNNHQKCVEENTEPLLDGGRREGETSALVNGQALASLLNSRAASYSSTAFGLRGYMYSLLHVSAGRVSLLFFPLTNQSRISLLFKNHHVTSHSYHR